MQRHQGVDHTDPVEEAKCLFFRFCRNPREHFLFPFFVDELGRLFPYLGCSILFLTGHGLLRVSTRILWLFFLLYHRWDLLSLLTASFSFFFPWSFTFHFLL